MRELDPLVSAAPVLQAGPAHIATLKTFDPPLRELEGRRFAGAGRRGKWLLFPTADKGAAAARPPDERRADPASRLRRKGAEDARVQAPLRERRRARAHRGRVEEAGRGLARVARADRGRARAPRPGGARARTQSSCARSWPATTGGCTRSCATSGRSPGSGGRTRTRSCIARSSRRSRSPATSTTTEIERLAAAIEEDLDPRARAADRREGRQGRLPRPPAPRRAVPAVRRPAAAGRLRGAHRLLLRALPDGRPRFSRIAGCRGCCVRSAVDFGAARSS